MVSLLDDVPPITPIIKQVVRRSGLSMEMIAEQLGKSPSTLYAELNPKNPSAKLGADDILKIIVLCKDHSPIVWLEATNDRIKEQRLRGTTGG